METGVYNADVDRANEVRADAHFPDETSTTHALLALVVVMLGDIRADLQSLVALRATQ